MEVDPTYGHYLILATVVGGPVGRELVLFRGYSAVEDSVSELPLRGPVPIFRKGDVFDESGIKLSSFTLPTANRLSGGSSTAGLGRAIQDPLGTARPSHFVSVFTLSDGSVSLVRGTP